MATLRAARPLTRPDSRPRQGHAVATCSPTRAWSTTRAPSSAGRASRRGRRRGSWTLRGSRAWAAPGGARRRGRAGGRLCGRQRGAQGVSARRGVGAGGGRGAGAGRREPSGNREGRKKGGGRRRGGARVSFFRFVRFVRPSRAGGRPRAAADERGVSPPPPPDNAGSRGAGAARRGRMQALLDAPRTRSAGGRPRAAPTTPSTRSCCASRTASPTGGRPSARRGTRSLGSSSACARTGRRSASTA